MKTNRMMTAAAVLLGAMTFTAAIAHAQDNMGDMSGHSHAGHQHMMMSNDAMMMADNGSAPMAAHRVSGEVKKIDLAKGEIKIRHEAIAHLDMMAMTMVFKAKDKADLANLKVGDRITFQAESLGGVLTAIEIKKQ
ncbi:MAG: copper-binding protein [Gammaproteobacteria bacterium]|nr:copper-binding protein [Gammaproteobacteria bacterium]HQT01723.1 copper-binding protein [Thiotrichales bacterium]HQT04425.1 copper-binding protein [Thiotrichales bacterium]